MKELLIIAVGAAIVNNVVLSQFLGICAFLGVSKNRDSCRNGRSGNLCYYPVLFCYGSYLQIYPDTAQCPVFADDRIYFSHCSVSAVSRDVFEKIIPSLYQALGVYLPLITTNCAVLGVALNNVTKSYTILQGVVNGLATSIGFFIAIVIMAGIREKIEYNDIPKRFQGTAIVLITAALMSIAFMGFSGMI